MKHGKRLNARTVVLNYTDKAPAGKPLTALRWTPGAVDTCELDAPATQAHTGHTTAPLPAGGDGPQRSNHTAPAASAPRPASGPDTSGTAQRASRPVRQILSEPELSVLGGAAEPAAPSKVVGDLVAVLVERDLDRQAAVVTGGLGGGAVGVAHVIIKHHPVTDVNNIPSQILGGSMNAEQADTFANAARLLTGGLVGLEVGEGGAKLTGVAA